MGSAAAQEGGGDLGAPPASPGADLVTPPPTAPTEPVQPPSADPGTETSDVPPPPQDAPLDYERRNGRRYPSGDRSVAEAREHGVRIPSRIATRLRVLDSNFATLSSRGGSSLVDGILSIVTGGLAITLGIVVGEPLSPYLYVSGGASVARGLIELILTPNASDPAIEFAHMPMGNMAEVQARLRFGEEQLESLADRTQLARILDASLSIASGVAVVPIYLGPNDFEVDEFGAFTLIFAGISVVAGVINLLSTSEAERRWSAYEELRARLDSRAENDELAAAAESESADDDPFEGDEASRGPTLGLGGGPLPGGGALTVTGSF